MSEASHERRRFQRIAFDAPVQLSQGQQHWNTVLHDLSLKGLLVVTPADWNGNAEQPIEVLINLDQTTQLRMETYLTRSAADYLGFECQHIDLESISHLRRLVELNLGNTSLLERELATLIDEL